MLHLELIEAAAAAGKDIFCEKPVGGTPEQTRARGGAAREAGVITGVGYNYRWAPLVQYARQLIADGHARRDHQLPRALLLDVRERPARPAVVALPARRGGPRRVDRPAQPRRRPRAHAARPDHARGRARRRRSSASGRCPPRGTHYGRGSADDPRGRGHERGLRGDAVRVRLRRARHVRGEPHDRRAREPDGVRRLRHARGAELEPRAAQRAAGLPRRGRAAHRLPHGVRRRPLPVPRQLRPRQRERDRVRGPRGDRGLRVPALGRRAAAAPAGLRGRAGVRARAGGAAAVGARAGAGRTCDDGDAARRRCGSA